MLLVLWMHLLLTAVCAALSNRLGPKVFLLAALGPLSGAALLATSGDVLQGVTVRDRLTWVPGLDLSVSLRLDPLAHLMLLLVCGVGTVIFCYTAWYASRGPTLRRLVWQLTAFAGAMVGLVLADDVVTLYVFWELTSITSFLLVGLDNEQEQARRAAQQALLITVLGGLVMFVGLLLLAAQAGTTRLSTILAQPPQASPGLTVALLLILTGAVTKSAQFPFHNWLPGAMSAPTPVSAYLHAAAMVKAGIYLVARLSPTFCTLSWWRPLLVSLAVVTMILGGYRALRQHDLKRLLAFSTVSQLGLLMVAAAWGTPASQAALTVLLLAHGFAKAALFMTVGVVDHATHTRDLRRLTGLARRFPVVSTAAALAVASMSGVPLLLGFIAKEELLGAVRATAGAGSWFLLTGLVIGSSLTVAYSLRLWWGAFGIKVLPATDPDAPVEPVILTAHRQPLGMTAPVVLLAGIGLALGVFPSLLDQLAAGVTGEPVHLALWHGLQPELGISALAMLGGVGLFAARVRVTRLQDAVRVPLDADTTFDATLRMVHRTARWITGRTQTGSLPQYLAVTALTVCALPIGVLAWRARQDGAWMTGTLRPADSGVQLAVCLLICGCAIQLGRTCGRVAAVLLLGAVGYGVALLFAQHGAPDLALTQLLVETVSLVVFLFILRLLPTGFTLTARAWDHRLRLVVAGTVGVTMATLAYVASRSRGGGTVATELADRSYPQAHGRNIVNVILVDFRGFDTFGEISVVFVAALGVASLTLGVRHQRRAPGAAPSPVLSVSSRILVPLLMLGSLFLLLAGHNNPGGGFIGGLVGGLALVLVYLSGEEDVLARARFSPRVWLGVGLLLSSVATVGPWLFGRETLQSSYLSLHLPALGKVGLSTVLIFDTGVYLVVTGMVLTILATLGTRDDAALAHPTGAR